MPDLRSARGEMGMSSVSITITGIDKLIAQLGRLEGMNHLRAPMQRAVYRLQARMAQYPAQRPNSTYRRTGTLGRKWTTKITQSASELVGSVGNNTEYAPYVQAYRFQARVHRGRWINTDKYVMDTEQRNIVRDFEDTIAQRIRG